MAEQIINWRAQEHAARKKDWGWYFILFIISAIFITTSIILKWWSVAILLVVAAGALVTYAVRPPRIIHYSLSKKGITEGNKLHSFDEFKSFGILIEGDNCSIMFTPKQKFMPRAEMFFPQSQGEEIVDFLGARLPMEEVKLDLLDKIVRSLRI